MSTKETVSVYRERIRKKLSKIYRIRNGVRFVALDDLLTGDEAFEKARALRREGSKAFVERNRMVTDRFYVFAEDKQNAE